MFRMIKLGVHLAKNKQATSFASPIKAIPRQNKFSTASNESSYQRLSSLLAKKSFKQKSKKMAFRAAAVGSAMYVVYKGFLEPELTLQSISATDFPLASNETPRMPEVKTVDQLNISIESEKVIYVAIQQIYIAALAFGALASLIYMPLITLSLLAVDVCVHKGEFSKTIFTSPMIKLMCYLVSPSNALKNQVFQQRILMDEVSQHCPDLKFDKNGYCYGLTNMWYLYQCAGRDLISELNELIDAIRSDTPLTVTQKKLLTDVSSVQKNQGRLPLPIYIKNLNTQGDYDFCHKKIKYTRASREDFEIKDKERAIKVAVDNAITHPDVFVALTVFDKYLCGVGHIIGLKAHYTGNDMTIKYFDTNCGEATFDNALAAQKGLSRLITLGYIEGTKSLNFQHIVVRMHSPKEKQATLFWKNASFLGKRPVAKDEAQQHQAKIFAPYTS